MVTEPKYYFKDSKNGLFHIRKRIGQKTEHFGAYKKEEEAKLAIQIFKKTGWHKEDRWVVKAEVKEIMEAKNAS